LQVKSFYSLLEESALYSAVKDTAESAVNDTICSLLLSVLPRPEYKYKEELQSDTLDNTANCSSKTAQLLYWLQKSLHKVGGFCYMEVQK